MSNQGGKVKCKFFFELGYCKLGDDCKFYHGTQQEVEEYKNSYYIEDMTAKSANAASLSPPRQLVKSKSKNSATSNKGTFLTKFDFFNRYKFLS